MGIASRVKQQGVNAHASNTSTTIVVGAGPVGYRCALELSRLCLDTNVILIGGEAVEPYNRIKLSSLLAGETEVADILTPLPSTEESSRIQFVNAVISDINPQQQSIRDSKGRAYRYDKLILATGSRPRLPELPGVSLNGIYTFRTLQDVDELLKQSTQAKHCVVIGGGLLGLEAARGMNTLKCDVTVLQATDRLMDRQLDKATANTLQKRIEKAGIAVVTNALVSRFIGNQHVEGVEVGEGKIIGCDIVVVCAGVKPNIELAKTAGLNVDIGIKVSKTLETSHENIYAVGECSECEGAVSGLVAPGLEQAKVVSKTLAGIQSAYVPASEFSQLKIQGEYVASIGDVTSALQRDDVKLLNFHRSGKGLSRTLILKDNKLIAACCVGDWQQMQSLRDSFRRGIQFSALQLLEFRLFGRVPDFKDETNTCDDVVCHCYNVRKPAIEAAVTGGAGSLADLGTATGAGTVCGSCHPRLQGMLKKPLTGFLLPDVPGKTVLKSVALISAILVFSTLLYPGLPSVESVQNFQYDLLWKSELAKQVTGFTLVGFTLIGLLVSLRKRLQWAFLGNYGTLRVLHSVLGLATLLVLLMHTGMHLGANLNRILMINFLGVILLGGFAALVTVFANKFELGTPLKKLGLWLHILVSWPLPALICAHILTVYYF